MLQSTENTIKYIEDGVLEHKTRLGELYKNIIFPNSTLAMVALRSRSIGNQDAIFLQLACLVEKPKKIMEIGTWLGTSAYAMAQTSDALIYTCDEGPDNFYIHEGNESYANRIIRHPETHSSKFFKKIDGGFDFVFVDGWLNDDDAEGIFEKCEDNFTFIAHDYYRPEKPKPVFCKGYQAVERMLKYAWENGYETELYPPSPDWLDNPYASYLVKLRMMPHNININNCCVMIKFERT
jgi:hypothetical protein